MTRKHYKEVARILKEVNEMKVGDDDSRSINIKEDVIFMIAGRLSILFKSDNPRFDRTRFLNAINEG
jgi:hypothetical protein